MSIFDIFSKRQKRKRGEFPDVYQYESIPSNLRVQIAHILQDALGNPDGFSSKTLEYFELIHDTLCREYGQFRLVENQGQKPRQKASAVISFLLEEENTEKVLDVVELGFRIVDQECRSNSFQRNSAPDITPDEAINELNNRFKEHGVGFEYQSSKIIRIDSQIIHTETIKPALNLLQDKRFAGANDEFLNAHEHYRHERYKECLNDCLKAFESTMKSICEIKGWKYDEKYTSKKLIQICFNNNLIPSYLQSHFSSLRANLESGVPTIRNKDGGHGQGTREKSIPDYFAAFQLHLTASNILFLIKAVEN